MNDQQHSTFLNRLLVEIADTAPPEEVMASTDLTNGILDSLGIVEILELIEEVYGISISEDGISRNDFRTVETINSLVASRLG